MIRNYLLVALKVLWRRKFFTFISLFGISFTLLVLTVATSFLDHTFGPHAPELKQDRMLGVYSVRLSSENGNNNMTDKPGYKFLNEYVRTIPSAEKVSIFSEFTSAATYRNGEEVKLYLKRTDGQYWEILDFQFLEGRPFTKEDEQRANFVAVINEATREKLFNGKPAVGKTITLDGQSFKVIGVVKNAPIIRMTSFSDVWVPLSTFKTSGYKETFTGGFQAAILAKDKQDLDLIRSDFKANLTKVQLPDPKTFRHIYTGADTYFESFARNLEGGGSADARTAPLIGVLVMLAVMFVILPTINLVNINISRIMERASEIGVRKAFGASSMTLVGQFIVENILLTIIGGLIGFILSYLILDFFNTSRLDSLCTIWAQLPHFYLCITDDGYFWNYFRCVSGLAYVQATSGASFERRCQMIRHLLKLIWNRKRSNFLIMLEIFFAFWYCI
jgi:putative ABC transport system permease protein